MTFFERAGLAQTHIFSSPEKIYRFLITFIKDFHVIFGRLFRQKELQKKTCEMKIQETINSRI